MTRSQDLLDTRVGFSHRIMAGCVDDLNLFKVSVQKLAPDREDVTAATVILLYCYRLRETRPGAGRAADQRERERLFVLYVTVKALNHLCNSFWSLMEAGSRSGSYVQELSSLQIPQVAFLSRYMGQPYAAMANNM